MRSEYDWTNKQQLNSLIMHEYINTFWQWVDNSGDSGTWYYQVAAYNHHCPPESAEGPW